MIQKSVLGNRILYMIDPKLWACLHQDGVLSSEFSVSN